MERAHQPLRCSSVSTGAVVWSGLSIWLGMSVVLRGHSSTVLGLGQPRTPTPISPLGKGNQAGLFPNHHGRAFGRHHPSVAVWGPTRAMQGPGALLCSLPCVPLSYGML